MNLGERKKADRLSGSDGFGEGNREAEKRGVERTDGADAAAPVVAVALLVAITVVLAAVVGTLGLGLATTEERGTATAAVEVDQGNGVVSLITLGNADEVVVKAEGKKLGSMTQPGESVPITVSGEVEVDVIGVSDGDEQLLRSEVVRGIGAGDITLALTNEGKDWDGTLPFEAQEAEKWDVDTGFVDVSSLTLEYCVDDSVSDGDLAGTRCTEGSLDGINVENDALDTTTGELVQIDTFRIKDGGGNEIDKVETSGNFVDDGRNTVALSP